jgi:hypothetical protein
MVEELHFPLCMASNRTQHESRGPSSRWSQHVTETSDALDLEPGVFSSNSPRQVAESLMRSANQSRRRKSSPFRSAMSMLTFYINRAGSKLPAERLKVLNNAKEELRRIAAKSRE